MSNSRPAAHVCKLYDTEPTHSRLHWPRQKKKKTSETLMQCGEQVCIYLQQISVLTYYVTPTNACASCMQLYTLEA